MSRADALAGIAWWNALTVGERAYWLTRAKSCCPADAWAAYKADTAEVAREAELRERFELLARLRAHKRVSVLDPALRRMLGIEE